MNRSPLKIDLALQGGGAHGAFTWGVLDRLLDETWLTIDGISGTSAGAMNAVVLAHGYAQDGAAGARAALEQFWRKVSHAARFSPFQRGPLDVLLGRWTLVGFGAVVAALPPFTAVRDWVLTIEGGPLVSLAVATNVLAALTGSASGA